MNYDVFISCKSEDYPLAKPIYDYLVECGLVVFLASEELRNRGVAFYGEIIDEALDSADHMIVFASKAEYVTTPYVSYEWRTFAEELRSGRKGGNIVTVLKGVSVPKLPIGLRNYQSFDYNDYRDLISYLPVKGGAVPPPQPKPQPKPQPTTKTYKVGDLYDDGTKRGVVFEVTPDGRHGKIVSLEQTQQRWSNEYEWTGATSRTDGMANMRAIQAIGGWREKYPAFDWCADMGDGCYLPAIEELRQYTLNKDIRMKVNQMLSQYNELIQDYRFYWSSTEHNNFCAEGVDRGYGDVDTGGKDNWSGYVRYVAKF